MSKMNELSLVITELKRCGEALIGISESLADLFTGSENPETPVQSETAPASQAKKPIALETVRALLAEKSRAGHTTKVRELLKNHGAEKLSEINPSEYPALLAEAEELGNG
jgi:hypothetical protein